ncbi:hypothetical protein AKJ09_10849 [Labilithrix luteola]|uniref:Uncharacterized protein n=1 Tax=Labilithrix luteola TaxID=1391654 RepID=A0A0K1QEJ5_9BACT|nr:hypothetical protein [Labilithrix luteola]AKV04186.1 hypothetical protein AKJ09_10849 [Labilithrix luteola]
MRSASRITTVMALAAIAGGCTLVTSLDGLSDEPQADTKGGDGGAERAAIDGSDASATVPSAHPDGDAGDASGPDTWCTHNAGDASFCADFDLQDQQALALFTELVQDAGSTTLDPVTSTSSPNSLAAAASASDASVSAGSVGWKSPVTNATTADIRFDVRFDLDTAGSAQSHTFARVVVDGTVPSPATWVVELSLGSTGRLYLGTRDLATNTVTNLFYGSNAQLSVARWMNIHMRVDIFGSGSGEVSLELDGTSIGSAMVTPPVFGGTFTCSFGIVRCLAPHAAFATHTDNLTIDVH